MEDLELNLIKIIGIIAVTLFTSSAFADSVSLHLFKSPKGINWSSPWTMTYSTLKNSLVKTGSKRAFAISHVFVEVKCDSTGEHIFRGQTSADDSEERELLFKKGYGLGLMFHTYKGKYEKDEAILKDMAPYEGSARRGEYKALISPSTCQRLLKYEREYQARNFGSLYSGLQADPLKGEGTGCSAFGMSFMRVGGLTPAFVQNWKNIIDVPKRFVGGPLTGNRVSVLKLLTHPGAKWSNKEAHIHLEAWNPEKMLEWVVATHNLIDKGGVLPGYDVVVDSVGNSKSVTVDLTSVPTPTGPIWLY